MVDFEGPSSREKKGYRESYGGMQRVLFQSLAEYLSMHICEEVPKSGETTTRENQAEKSSDALKPGIVLIHTSRVERPETWGFE